MSSSDLKPNNKTSPGASASTSTPTTPTQNTSEIPSSTNNTTIMGPNTPPKAAGDINPAINPTETETQASVARVTDKIGQLPSNMKRATEEWDSLKARIEWLERDQKRQLNMQGEQDAMMECVKKATGKFEAAREAWVNEAGGADAGRGEAAAVARITGAREVVNGAWIPGLGGSNMKATDENPPATPNIHDCNAETAADADTDAALASEHIKAVITGAEARIPSLKAKRRPLDDKITNILQLHTKIADMREARRRVIREGMMSQEVDEKRLAATVGDFVQGTKDAKQVHVAFLINLKYELEFVMSEVDGKVPISEERGEGLQLALELVERFGGLIRVLHAMHLESTGMIQTIVDAIDLAGY